MPGERPLARGHHEAEIPDAILEEVGHGASLGLVRPPRVAGVPTFSFHELWWLPAAPAAVRDVLVDLYGYPEWWPQVVAVASLGPDDARVLCRSALPYTLDLVVHAVGRELPVLEVELAGHLRGRVRWRLDPEDGGTRRHCARCGADHFPRVDPVVIMLPIFKGKDGGQDHCLVGRNARFAGGLHSAFAGFIEPP